MSELFRLGYRDARLGEDWIKCDQPSQYYDGVAKAMREKEAMRDCFYDNHTGE